MPITTEIALVSVPMAVYLYVLGIFHGGKHPRVVTGPGDLAWLMFSLSGLVAFGPFGRAVVAGLFGSGATATAWVAWVAGLLVVAGLVARSARRRVVVYHVEPDQIRGATAAALVDLGSSFQPTLNGFEDLSQRTGLSLRTSVRTRTAVIEAQGEGAALLMTSLRPALRSTLAGLHQPVSSLSTAFFTASGLVMSAPMVGFVLFDPQGRRAVRSVVRWLGWG